MEERQEPIAYITGKPVIEPPVGLFIQADALKVFLEDFSGPLDILLHLVRRQNIDIVDIDIAKIAEQYLEYIRIMKEFKINPAAEYLVMASVLTELKSRSLLPRSEEEQEENEEMRHILVEKLKEYEKIRNAAAYLEELPRLDRDFFIPFIRYETPPLTVPKILPEKEELAQYMRQILFQNKMRKRYEIKLEELSTRERMTKILDKIGLARQLGISGGFVPFEQLFTEKEGAEGVAVSLIALTQLLKEKLAEVAQSAPYSKIFVYSPEGKTDDTDENDEYESKG